MTAKEIRYEQQRQQLATWLATYELDRQLREPADPAPNQSVTAARMPRRPPVHGHIRLLPPAATSLPELERPVYVLLLPGNNHHTTTLIPFSRFDTPATPQEWRTRLKQNALQVLCFWNARAVQTAALAATWLAHSVTEKQYQQARNIYQNLHSMGALAGTRFGPPLRHPLDPRHIYMYEEQMLLDDLLAALQEAEAADNTIPYWIPEPDTQLLRAAEPPQYPEEPPPDN